MDTREQSELYRAHPDAWEHGYNSGAIRFSYLNPNYSKSEVAAWSEGYTVGKAQITRKQEVNT